ncbi:hypothetical protein [Cytophaga aurantiaca]|uniref:hypothetical protein n=1 Tax=Cytophaga aurantiaca TaxID=29530 RepID=UPI000380CEEC|nr:hypothetical protein [Cytophaga aurantiaca]
MKKLITLALFITFCSSSVFGQSKSDLLLQIDSLKKANVLLKKNLDSVSQYTIVYKEIRKKVVRYNFKPADFPKILDSILTRRDSTVLGTKLLHDSLSRVNTQNLAQKDEIAKLKYFVEEFGGNEVQPSNAKDLMGVWGLNLSGYKVIGDTARNGLVVDKLTNTDKLVQINLIDTDFAEVQFTSGKTIKCFYKINSFSTNGAYYIDFSKGDDLNIRLYIIQTETGMKVSYKGKGNTLLYGVMKRI